MKTNSALSLFLRRKAAFTLVELSIVLVIIGLLVGAILAGQTIIHAAEMKSILTDYGRYSVAVRSFRDKYSALPGDMPNATAFWGNAGGASSNGSDAACYNTESTGTATCNGNGNGQLGLNDFGATTNVQAPEWYRAWQHLANAGLIEGTYTGTREQSAFDRHAVIGKNIPKSKIPNAGWNILSYGPTLAGDPAWWQGRYPLILILGTQTNDYEASYIALTPEDAWNIDVKSDDGKPGTGGIRSMMVWSNCQTTQNQTAAAYNLTYTSAACSLIFGIDPIN